MKREKPKKAKNEMKQVHFDMELDMYLEFEKIVYGMGYSVSEYLRMKVQEVINEGR